MPGHSVQRHGSDGARPAGGRSTDRNSGVRRERTTQESERLGDAEQRPSLLEIATKPPTATYVDRGAMEAAAKAADMAKPDRDGFESVRFEEVDRRRLVHFDDDAFLVDAEHVCRQPGAGEVQWMSVRDSRGRGPQQFPIPEHPRQTVRGNALRVDQQTRGRQRHERRVDVRSKLNCSHLSCEDQEGLFGRLLPSIRSLVTRNTFY